MKLDGGKWNEFSVQPPNSESKMSVVFCNTIGCDLNLHCNLVRKKGFSVPTIFVGSR